MTYSAAERKDIRRAEKAAKLADTQRLEIITNLMSAAPGRAWVCDLLEACHIFTTTYTGDALSGAFSEGERNVGLRLLADIMSACPQRYLEMMRERNDRHLAADSGHRRGNSDADGGDSSAAGSFEDASPTDDLDDPVVGFNKGR